MHRLLEVWARRRLDDLFGRPGALLQLRGHKAERNLNSVSHAQQSLLLSELNVRDCKSRAGSARRPWDLASARAVGGKNDVNACIGCLSKYDCLQLNISVSASFSLVSAQASRSAFIVIAQPFSPDAGMKLPMKRTGETLW